MIGRRRLAASSGLPSVNLLEHSRSLPGVCFQRAVAEILFSQNIRAASPLESQGDFIRTKFVNPETTEHTNPREWLLMHCGGLIMSATFKCQRSNCLHPGGVAGRAKVGVAMKTLFIFNVLDWWVSRWVVTTCSSSEHLGPRFQLYHFTHAFSTPTSASPTMAAPHPRVTPPRPRSLV